MGFPWELWLYVSQSYNLLTVLTTSVINVVSIFFPFCFFAFIQSPLSCTTLCVCTAPSLILALCISRSKLSLSSSLVLMLSSNCSLRSCTAVSSSCRAWRRCALQKHTCIYKQRSFSIKCVNWIQSIFYMFSIYICTVTINLTCPAPLQSWPGWNRAAVQLSELCSEQRALAAKLKGWATPAGGQKTWGS